MSKVIPFPKPPVPPIRAIEEDELRAAAALFLLAVERPEKRAEIVSKIADYLAEKNGGLL